jgi:hypothetical protein
LRPGADFILHRRRLLQSSAKSHLWGAGLSGSVSICAGSPCHSALLSEATSALMPISEVATALECETRSRRDVNDSRTIAIGPRMRVAACGGGRCNYSRLERPVPGARFAVAGSRRRPLVEIRSARHQSCVPRRSAVDDCLKSSRVNQSVTPVGSGAPASRAVYGALQQKRAASLSH